MTVHDQDPYSQGPLDSDPEETSEWQQSLDELVDAKGHGRGREIMLSLLKRSKDLHLGVPMVPTTWACSKAVRKASRNCTVPGCAPVFRATGMAACNNRMAS